MRELTNIELNVVSGGFGLLGVPAALGLIVGIPGIVIGALLMAGSIALTAVSGIGALASLVLPIA